ncbi:LPXTG cell wall anchor domain-containing protein [Micromonospora thermarum]|uniref:LPXTG cell wall anchor domain-containing protein n=1 Tax=Micromonospora thermarum TaxID=2720024 RepID=UPI00197B95FE|nr:LPXTG cell wall anchor domain-containing protein [Micromonospora thermarum]
MPQRRRVVRAAVIAAATASLALAAPAWAAPGGNNPPGDNGTVKIDGKEFEDHVDNQPHVTCEFELEFFNFDTDQAADITLTAQPPSGTDKVVWSIKNKIISTDPASGAENDHDEVIKLSAADLDLAGLKQHEKHGYHLKLDVDLVEGQSSDAKHKVFWLEPCRTSPTPTTPAPTTPVPTTPGGNGGGGEDDPSLPITGVAGTGIALTGLALIGGGVALTVLRRRRDNVTFTS